MNPAKLTSVFKSLRWWEDRGFTLVVVALALICAYLTFRMYRWTYDDVFIAFTYAKNIVDGEGFVFNSGEHFLGTPAPLFVLLLVIGDLLTPSLSIPEIGGIISGFSLFAGAIVLYLLGRDLANWFVGLALALFSIFNPLIYLSFSSETPLFLALTLAAFYTYFRGHNLIAAVWLALAVLCRSEALIPAAIIFAHMAWSHRRAIINGLRQSLIPAAGAYGLVVTPWLLFSFLSFGSPLTNSFIAKQAQVTAGLLPPFSEGPPSYIEQLVIRGDESIYLGIILVGLGLLYLPIADRRWLLLLSWPVLQTLFYTQMDVPFYHWYAAAPALGLSILAGLGTAIVPIALNSLKRINGQWPLLHHRSDRGSAFQTWGTALAPVSLLASMASVLVLAGISTSAGASRIIDLSKDIPGPMNGIYTQAGKWFRNNAEADTSIAYLEIGQIAFYSERRVIDVLGLVTPGAAERVAKADFLWAYMQHKPDYIIYNGLFHRWLSELLSQSWFPESYQKVAEISEPGYSQPLVIYQKRPGASIPDATTEVDVFQTEEESVAGEILPGNAIGQTFVSNRDNLSGIQLKLATYARQNNQPLVFHLKRSPESASDLFRAELKPETIIDNGWYFVAFPPIVSSKEQSFYFYLEAPQATPGDAFTALASLDSYPGGALFRNHLVDKGDLVFKTRYTPSYGQTVRQP